MTQLQAYETLNRYLGEYCRQLPEAGLGEVLSEMNPHTGIWADGSPVDPAVPRDWSRAAAAMASQAGPLTGEDAERSRPERDWLRTVFPYLVRLWNILGDVPLEQLIAVLAQKDAAIPGSSMTPWQLWIDTDEGVLQGRPDPPWI